MSGVQQGWLVAVREMRERSRSRAFRASLGVMLLAVLAVILVPALLDGNEGTLDVGLTGDIPDELPRAISEQSEVAGETVDVHRFDDVAAGEAAVRQGDIDVLVVDAGRLEWRRQADEQLQSVLTGAIQIVAVQERAAAAGIGSDELLALVAPVPSRVSSSPRLQGGAPTTRWP